ncbi:MAG: heterodisulfide reductase-related iron-sulfur binding cluster [Vulcanimicrobiaceae bacterium]
MSTRTYADLISDCVHCGFCLPACPTYRSWGVEMDSPRGRIDLMKGVEENAIPLSDVVRTHIDRCLGCMACVTACPSGVRYDLLIESTRAKVETQTRRPFFDRLFRDFVFAIFPYPARLAALRAPLQLYISSGLQTLVRRSGFLNLLPARLQQLEDLAPPAAATEDLPAHVDALGTKRMHVGLVTGCVQRVFFPNVNAATLRVLSAEGCEVDVPGGQGCCGALSLHSGREEEAKRFARALIDRFDRESYDAIVINAAGCGSAMKGYDELFAGEPEYREKAARFASRVRDVNELVAGLEPQAPRGRIDARVAYHDACHLAHAQGIRAEPRRLLQQIPGLELCEIPDGDQCCGSAGTYNLFEPESAREIGDRKADNVLKTQTRLIASANPGCTLQIQSRLRARGESIESMHPIEFLDQSIQIGNVV